MKDFFTSSKFKIFIAFIFIMLGLILYTASTENSFLSSALGFIVTPLQKISTDISQHASEVTASKKSTEELETENAELKEEVRKLRSLVVDYYEIKKENAQYSKYYELKHNNPSLKFMPASVIGRDPNENFYSFTVDQGSLSGVSENDPVITENGLIGVVYSVGPNFCKIRSILSPDAKVGAIDKMNMESGVIVGKASLADQNLTRLSFISSQHTMKKGDILVTSGLSGVYPADLKIGEIKEFSYDEYDASLYAVVKPFEDIRDVKDVFIVVGFQNKGEISKGSSEISTVSSEAE